MSKNTQRKATTANSRKFQHTTPASKNTCASLEIRPGEGGADAENFAKELADALSAYALRNGVACKKEIGRTITLTLNGSWRDLALNRFIGTHRIQRIPKNDKAGRRHTSTATIALLEAPPEPGFTLCDDDIRVDFYRGHGKGGQHRNKTSSAVRVTHLPTGIVVAIERGRQQGQNLELAKEELRARLQKQQRARSKKEYNAARVAQITTAQRPTKQWTWNTQRGEVIDHETQTRYQLKKFLAGRLEADEAADVCTKRERA